MRFHSTACSLAYLHEGLEPKVVHRDVKSSNILLDRQWNARVSDFGLAKLIRSERTYVTTRVMGTFGSAPQIMPKFLLKFILLETREKKKKNGFLKIFSSLQICGS